MRELKPDMKIGRGAFGCCNSTELVFINIASAMYRTMGVPT